MSVKRVQLIHAFVCFISLLESPLPLGPGELGDDGGHGVAVAGGGLLLLLPLTCKCWQHNRQRQTGTGWEVGWEDFIIWAGTMKI